MNRKPLVQKLMLVMMSILVASVGLPATGFAADSIATAQPAVTAARIASGQSMLGPGVPAGLSAQVSELHAQAGAPKPSLVVRRAASGKVFLKRGSTYSLGAVASRGARIEYKSTMSSVVSVSKAGKVKARADGAAWVVVVAKDGWKKTTKKVRAIVVPPSVYRNVRSIKATAAKRTLAVGKSVKIKTSFGPSDAMNKNLVYKSSSPKVLSVNAKGKVKARRAGSAKITVASAANPKAKRVLKFKAKPVKVRDISASTERPTLQVGQRASVKTRFAPLNASNKKLTYKSSNSKVLSVSADGKIVAKKAGSATITVKSASNRKAASSVRFAVVPKVKGEADRARGVYDKGSLVVSAKDAAVSDGGRKVRISAGALDEDPVPGRILVVADGNLQGTAVRVTSVRELADGTLVVEGERPSFADVFDELHMSGCDAFSELSVSEVAEGVEVADAGSGLVAQAEGTIAAGSLNVKLTHKFFKDVFDKKKLGGDGANLKLKMDGSVSLTVTPTVDYALDYSWWGGLERLKVMVNMNEKIAGDITIGAAFKAKIFHLGAAKTGVDVYFTVGVDGKVGLACTSRSSTGIDYAKDRSGFFKKTNETKVERVEFSAEGTAGVGLEGTVGVLCFDVGKLGVETGGKASASETPHADKLKCTDVSAWWYMQASYEVDDFIAKLGGWDAKGRWDVLNKDNSPFKGSWHYENGRKVAACTWGATGGSGGSGSTGGNSDVNIEDIAREFMGVWYNDWTFKDGKMVNNQNSVSQRCLPYIAEGTLLYDEFCDKSSFDIRTGSRLARGFASSVASIEAVANGSNKCRVDVGFYGTQNVVTQEMFNEMKNQPTHHNTWILTFNEDGKIVQIEDATDV